jgi:hypothetical protein
MYDKVIHGYDATEEISMEGEGEGTACSIVSQL